jgi:hypothetical protein
MCDDYEELDYFDFPGSEPGGYNILYPCDPVSQAEAMFSQDGETLLDTDDLPPTENRDPAGSRQTSSILLRLFIFLICLAFPPIWPVLWLLRSRRPR